MLGLVKAHVADVAHQVVLILVKHDLVVLVVVVPGLGVSWVLLGQHEDQVVFREAGVLVWIRDHVLHRLDLVGLALAIRWLPPTAALLLVQILVGHQVDPRRSVEAERDHLSSSRQVIKQLLVSLVDVVLGHLDVVHVARRDMREVLVIPL